MELEFPVAMSTAMCLQRVCLKSGSTRPNGASGFYSRRPARARALAADDDCSSRHTRAATMHGNPVTGGKPQ